MARWIFFSPPLYSFPLFCSPRATAARPRRPTTFHPESSPKLMGGLDIRIMERTEVRDAFFFFFQGISLERECRSQQKFFGREQASERCFSLFSPFARPASRRLHVAWTAAAAAAATSTSHAAAGPGLVSGDGAVAGTKWGRRRRRRQRKKNDGDDDDVEKLLMPNFFFLLSRLSLPLPAPRTCLSLCRAEETCLGSSATQQKRGYLRQQAGNESGRIQGRKRKKRKAGAARLGFFFLSLSRARRAL